MKYYRLNPDFQDSGDYREHELKRLEIKKARLKVAQLFDENPDEVFSYDEVLERFTKDGESKKTIGDIFLLFIHRGIIQESTDRNGPFGGKIRHDYRKFLEENRKRPTNKQERDTAMKSLGG
jgi:hypothetical protein